jgi:hypothetical protein
MKNNNILVGAQKDWTPIHGDSLVDDENKPLPDLIEYNLNGFALRGADNQGKCYFVENPKILVGAEL